MAPLADDNPQHVSGLAIEVRPGSPSTRYLIGARLHVAGQMLAEVPVECQAPNDIVGAPSERARIAGGRVAFGEAARAAFTRVRPASVPWWCATIRSAMRTTPGRPGSPRSAGRER